MLDTGYLLKIAKINSQQEKAICLIAKISSRNTQKITNLQKLTPAKISCHTVQLEDPQHPGEIGNNGYAWGVGEG